MMRYIARALGLTALLIVVGVPAAQAAETQAPGELDTPTPAAEAPKDHVSQALPSEDTTSEATEIAPIVPEIPELRLPADSQRVEQFRIPPYEPFGCGSCTAASCSAACAPTGGVCAPTDCCVCF